jgi:hypothetical protein
LPALCPSLSLSLHVSLSHSSLLFVFSSFSLPSHSLALILSSFSYRIEGSAAGLAEQQRLCMPRTGLSTHRLCGEDREEQEKERGSAMAKPRGNSLRPRKSRNTHREAYTHTNSDTDTQTVQTAWSLPTVSGACSLSLSVAEIAPQCTCGRREGQKKRRKRSAAWLFHIPSALFLTSLPSFFTSFSSSFL